MVSPLLAAGLTGLSFASGFLGDDGVSRRDIRRRGRHANRLQLNNIQRILGGSARKQLQQGLDARLSGFDQALRSTAEAGIAGRGRAREQGAQLAAAAQNNSISRGLAATDQAFQAQRAISADTAKALAEVDAAIGQIQADLQIGRGQAEAQGRSQLAGLDQAIFGALSDVNAREFDLLTGIQTPQRGGLDLSGLAALFSSIGGAGGGG